jgi:CheY-like chemotaxis protein
MPLCIVVDDHADSREGLAEYLKVHGFEVATAAGADDCEVLLSRQRPDAILLDLELPHVDGWELAHRIRENAAFRTIPLIAISACVMPADRERAHEAGCDRFIAKPCDPDVIVAELRNLLAARATGQ